MSAEEESILLKSEWSKPYGNHITLPQNFFCHLYFAAQNFGPLKSTWLGFAHCYSKRRENDYRVTYCITIMVFLKSHLQDFLNEGRFWEVKGQRRPIMFLTFFLLNLNNVRYKVIRIEGFKDILILRTWFKKYNQLKMLIYLGIISTKGPFINYVTWIMRMFGSYPFVGKFTK